MATEYYLVAYDDGKGNLGRESELLSFLKKNGFVCKGGFWGCPWYFISIKDKIYYPGRPGVSYGKTTGKKYVSFDKFKAILFLKV